jgi:hypothetical protein
MIWYFVRGIRGRYLVRLIEDSVVIFDRYICSMEMHKLKRDLYDIL